MDNRLRDKAEARQGADELLRASRIIAEIDRDVPRDPHPPTPMQRTATRALVLTAMLLYGGIALGTAGTFPGGWWDWPGAPTADTSCTAPATTPTLDAVPLDGDTTATLLGSAFASPCTGAAHVSSSWWITLGSDTVWSSLADADSLERWTAAGITAGASGWGPGDTLVAHVFYTPDLGASSGEAVDTFVATAVPLVFAMDYTGGAFPLAGWANFQDTVTHTYTARRAAGGGPQGQDAYALALLVDSVTPGDSYWGWGDDFGSGAPFAYGDTVYLRWRSRFTPGTNCLAMQQGDTALGGIWRNKWVVLNDPGDSGTERVIVAQWCNRSPLITYYRIEKGGGEDPAVDSVLGADTVWRSFQVRVAYSSAQDVPDGGYALFRDNNNPAAPTASVSGIVVNAETSPGHVQWGAYYNNGVYFSGVIGWDHSDFRIGYTFDEAWAP